ncbi:DUF1911 domain-containing protein [Janthinobacterium sp. HSC-3S05]|uniref:PoNe immunity protein domain-containing protein n=1 Tax=Janthinobacterium lividum TaxID=29581 RepID=UPI001CD82CB7|nr:PoNe immunity protein domain-containing protein [Janthinobacterium lividum]MCA1860156.1 DUF1911 domain-containing protein [Janthinobacterium lividum]
MNNIFSLTEFLQKKRESLFDYATYLDLAQDLTIRIPRVGRNMKNSEWMADKDAAQLMMMTQSRAWNSINLLSINYSAGVSLAVLRSFYPTALEYWEEYAKYDKAYDATPEGRETYVAHLPLLGEGFDQANRLVCLGILLGWGHLLPRLPDLLDYHNPRRDGMLERLLAFYLSERGTPPDECTRHRPYFKTLKIFAAPKEKRSELMAGYLDDWYHASRREPYHDSHTRGTSFMGYWSWEAAAITYLLDIDDHSYRDAQFYPGDLVDFARTQRNNPNGSSAPAQADGELRANAGEPCPKAGMWEALDIAPHTKFYEQGETMLDLGSAYGWTVWRYMES